ncbi:MAG TPA: helicase-related protein [Mesorhizobium sp.]|jgi:ATP-dependent RNA helicase SUPV3L1/SUV3|nr:helicase-related protein [Mesorhizobium sp.]
MTPERPSTQPLVLSGRDVTAVLGPTNTGKTHLAIERMVAHSSGVIGLPLRLLAREVYGRVCEKVGERNVALVTGEEKIIPDGARYRVCTVEAMPRETDAAFVAIDEVQLAGDLERGHVFTDRILHLRGREETLLLGAATMRGILEKLLRGISVVTRPRLSHLAYAGSKKITRLPRRSAIVAFSADEVYAIGELIRRQRGGVAVVLGALSPRTRNAQVALYQAGDVDYLVATDAIGMGLNLDVDHVAFAQNRKFDGFQFRDLNPGELGQIAGRAGRHLRDGTFGVTGRVDPFSDELVSRVESHDFDPVKVLQWRSAAFDFGSLAALKRSIEAPAPVEGLSRALPAVDVQALERLSNDPDVRDLATTRERVKLLWEACALPDYRRIAPAQHADLVASIFFDLARAGAVDEDAMAEQVKRADHVEGDIDTLSHRIAQIRTWTFVANQPGWLKNAMHWQETTRAIEDRLSDALHERLTKRFVDRRTSVLQRRLRENTMLEAEISPSGTVSVEGHHVGELQGFRFTADQTAGGEEEKAVRSAARTALGAEFEARAARFAAAPNGDLALASDGTIRWIGAPVATLVGGDDPLRPRVVLLADEQLTGPARDGVQARAERFVQFQVETHLKPLSDLRSAEGLSGLARGLAFRIVENLGLVWRRDITEEVKGLDGESRAGLRRLGVRFGAYHLFVPALVKPAPANLLSLLWALANDAKDRPGFGDVTAALASGRTSVVVDPSYDRQFYRLAGFRVLGKRAVRVDILERLADLIRPLLAWTPGAPRPDGAVDGRSFVVTPPMMSILGANAEDMEEILKSLGYRAEPRPAAAFRAKLAEVDEAARAAAAAKAAEAEAQAQAQAAEPPATEGEQPVEAASAEGEAETGADAAAAAGHEAAEPQSVAADEAMASVEADAPGEAQDDVMAADATPTEQPAVNVDDATPATEDALLAAEAPEAAAGELSVEMAAEEEKPILVWRPGRSDRAPREGARDGRRPQGGRGAEARSREGSGPRHRQGEARREGEGQTAAGAAPAESRGAGRDRPQRWDKNAGRREGGKDEQGGGQRFAGRPERDRRGEERRDRGGREDRKPERQSFRPPREERAPDPDSPFAKLAALRDQLRK